MSLSLVAVAAAVCVAGAMSLLVWALIPEDSTRAQALPRLNRGFADGSNATDPDGRSRGPLASTGRLLTPRGLLHVLDRWHSRAGRPGSWPMDRVLAAKVVLLALGLVVGVVFATSGSWTPRAILAMVLTPLFLWFLPDLLLLNTGMKRRQQITEALPDTLDQLSIAVEAGLGFEAALNHVARNTSGPLSEEVIRTLQDMRVGVPRRDAYLDLGHRTDVPDLRRFVRAIIQAEQRGVSIARVLNVQASEMRLKRSQRAEETAMKIPVKVIFPLMFCIMPALLVVIVGPAVLSIMSTFSN